MELENVAFAIHNILSSYTIHITLQWIPGRIEVQGNEHADKLAKEGTQKTQTEYS